MKLLFLLLLIAFSCFSLHPAAQVDDTGAGLYHKAAKNLYIDSYQLQPGIVTFEDVAKDHTKDLTF